MITGCGGGPVAGTAAYGTVSRSEQAAKKGRLGRIHTLFAPMWFAAGRCGVQGWVSVC